MAPTVKFICSNLLHAANLKICFCIDAHDFTLIEIHVQLVTPVVQYIE